MRFFVKRSEYGDAIEVRLGGDDANGSTFTYAHPVMLSSIEKQFSPPSEPMLKFTDDRFEAVQSLMDELWAIGIRPSDIGSPGHLAATQGHLADMRKLVSKTLGVTL